MTKATRKGSVGRWTRYFTVASALSMVGLQIAYLSGISRRTVALIGLLGAVLPMVVGMGYLLVPSVVDNRGPGVSYDQRCRDI